MNDISEIMFDVLENKATKAVIIYFDENEDLFVEGNVKLYEAIGMMKFAEAQIMYEEGGD